MGWLWLGLFVTGLVAEVVALVRRQPGDTLSETLRSVVLRHPTIAKATFAGWVAFAIWFAIHIWL